MSHPLPHIAIEELLARYHGLLLDAFGVLVDKQGPLPGAVRLIDTLRAEARPWFVLTNSASRLPETMERHYREQGLAIDVDHIISSGMLLTPHFEEYSLQGARSLVLGPDNSQEYVRRAGGEVMQMDEAGEADVVVIADQAGFDLLPGMNRMLSLVLGQIDAGRAPHLVLCNPDIIYPVGPGEFGFTAGGLAAMLEAILIERYPDSAYRFHRLGKPHAPIFAEGVKRLGTDQVIMIGDQVATDIRGANDYGLDSALIGTGLGQAGLHPHAPRPTWYLPDLSA
ncbi:MAG: HAD hydrolase-like protein [Gammaproteobacteria bacterium]|nr:HAD hydrolase-like protein [Gammaproteobacteria bacterium]